MPLFYWRFAIENLRLPPGQERLGRGGGDTGPPETVSPPEVGCGGDEH